MTPDEARRILERGCAGKVRYGERTARDVAKKMRARTGEPLEPYRCHLDATHWHVGTQPSLDRLEQIALAIRVLTGNAPGPPPAAPAALEVR